MIPSCVDLLRKQPFLFLLLFLQLLFLFLLFFPPSRLCVKNKNSRPKNQDESARGATWLCRPALMRESASRSITGQTAAPFPARCSRLLLQNPPVALHPPATLWTNFDPAPLRVNAFVTIV
jgi:hypothetical protein